MRCDQNQNFGYVIGHEKDGTCNFDIGKIKEIPEKKKTKPQIFVKNYKLTDEDLKLGESALNEILGEEDDFKAFKEESNPSDKSTEGNNSFENVTNTHIDLDEKIDYFNELNLNDAQLNTENNFQINKANEIFNEIITEIEKDEQKDNNKKEEESSIFRRVLSSIVDLLPVIGNAKAGLDAITGIDLITKETLDPKERLMSALSIIPGMNYASKGKKISKSLTIYNKAGKQAKASKVEKNVQKAHKKKDVDDKNLESLHDNHNHGNPNNIDKEGKSVNPYYYHEVHAKSRKDAWNKALNDGFGNKPIDHGDHFHQSRKRDGEAYKYGNTHYTWGKDKINIKDRKD